MPSPSYAGRGLRHALKAQAKSAVPTSTGGMGVRQAVCCFRAIAPTSAATMTAPARGYLLVRVEEASGKTQRGDLFTWDTTSGSFEAFVKGAPHSASACTLSSPAGHWRISVPLAPSVTNTCALPASPRPRSRAARRRAQHQGAHDWLQLCLVAC